MTASKMTQCMKSGIKDWASRRKTMIMRALSDSFRVSVYGGLLAGALTASAETLAWYKFSEQSDGVQATCVADTVLDSSGNGKAGTVVSVKDKEEGSDATLAPTYRSAYACRLYDPVSGNRWSSGTALDFAAVGKSASQTGATVKVANFIGATPPKFGSITVEALVCTTGVTCNVFAPIVGLLHSKTSATAEHWSLLMTSDGHVATRFSGKISYGQRGGGYSGGTHVINDGCWHTVALVHDERDVDGTVPTWSVYVDGELDATYKGDTKAANYNANVPLYIGGYSQTAGRIFNGLIDEVRITDEALAPEQLLRIERLNPIDSDTLVYIPFDSFPGKRSALSGNLNLVANGPSFTVKKSKVAPLAGDGPIPDYEFVGDRPCEDLANGRFARTSGGNGTALRLMTSTLTNGVGISGNSAGYMAGSFTAEIFFKTDEKITANFSSAKNLFRCGQSGRQSMWLRLGSKLMLTYNNRQEDGSYKATYEEIGNVHEFYDNVWHHLAVVYDRPAKRLTFYADRRLRCVVEDVDIETTNYYFFINNNPDSDNTRYFSGWVDEFRFTKRALGATEFLCPANDGEEADPDTLLRASFENDWMATSGWGTLADATADGDVSFVSSEDERLAGDMIWTNQTAGAACLTNFYAAKLAGGYVGFPEFPPYEGDDLTVEMFVKCESWDANASIFRLLYGNNPAYTGDPICSMYLASASDDEPQPTLRFRVAYETNYTGVARIATHEDGVEWFSLRFDGTGRNPLDGRWHHVAAVFSTYLDDEGLEQTKTTLFVDYQEGGSFVHRGHLPFRSVYSPRPRLSLGCGTDGSRLRGRIDEVRVTARALQPSEFLTATKFKRGMIILFR